MMPRRTSKRCFPTLISAQAHVVSSQSEPERWWPIVIEHARLNHVRARLQLFCNLRGHDFLPIAIQRKAYGNAIDFHLRPPHCAHAQTRNRGPIHQYKLVPERCIEAAKPMCACVDRGWKNDPLRPPIARQKIDCRIIPCKPSQHRHRHAGKCGDPNCSTPWLENEHCDVTFSIILALRSRAKTGKKHWRRQRNEQKVSRLRHV
jgi:hypothetical protein